MRARGLDWWTGVWLAVTAWAMARTLSVAVVPDTFLDLNAGRLIAEDGVPRHDTLTVVAGGRDWVDQQWLAHLVFRGAEAAGGLAAVALVASLAWLAAATVIVIDLRAQGLPGPRAAIVGFAAVLGTVSVTTARAQVWSLLLFAVLLVLLRRAEKEPRLAWWSLPVLVVWANVHGSVAVGAALVLAWAVVRRPRGWPVLAAAAPVALLATPYGTGIVDYLRDVTGNDAISDLVSEWRSPDLGDPVLAPFFALLAVSAVVLALQWRRVPLLGWLTVPPLAVASLQSQRFVGLFALAAAHLLGSLWARSPMEVRPVPRAARVVPWAIGALAVGTVVYAFALGDDFEARTDMPVGVSRALRALPADARVVADDQVSNYVLWKDRELWGRVAVDSRLELLSEREIRSYAGFLAGAAWRRYAAGYDAVVVDPRSHDELARAVRGAAGWRVLEDGPEALVAARR